MTLGSRKLVQVTNETFYWFIEYFLYACVILKVYIFCGSIRNEINGSTKYWVLFFECLLRLVFFNHSQRVTTAVKSCLLSLGNNPTTIGWLLGASHLVNLSFALASKALLSLLHLQIIVQRLLKNLQIIDFILWLFIMSEYLLKDADKASFI